MRKQILLLLVPVALIGCRATVGEKKPGKPEVQLPGQLSPFSGEEELSDYLKSLMEAEGDQDSEGASADAEWVGPADGESSASDAGPNQEITNNQEVGVDEGGLVKNYNDFLVTLRRGRLVTVRVGDEGSLTKVDEEAMTPEGLNNDVWYDELLISNDLALVIGYRYSIIPFKKYFRGATELNFFRISEEGELTRLDTYFFESNDYYSWKNYAGRVIEGKLVLYFPFTAGFFWDREEGLRLPRVFRHAGAGELEEVDRIIESTDLYKPLQELRWPTFHTLVVCDLTSGLPLNCHAQGVVDSWFRELYVSQERAYLWIDGERWWDPSAETGRARLYALGLNGNSSGVAEVEGSPIDQFSLSEREGGLDALTLVAGESPCDPRTGFRFHYQLVRLGLSEFGEGLRGETGGAATCLPGLWIRVNRFSGSHLAYGSDQALILVDRETGTHDSFELGTYIQRIELAGERFLVVGEKWSSTEGAALTLFAAEGGPVPRIVGSLEIPDLFQSEWRSHGYSFHESGETALFGLGTLELEPPAEDDDLVSPWSYSVTPSVNFFAMDEEGQISEVGQFSEQDFSRPSEVCTTSCIDWYGNTRPIFLEDHIIGLIGDQMASGSLAEGGGLQAQSYLQIFTGETL